jgi:hypothetical protein
MFSCVQELCHENALGSGGNAQRILNSDARWMSDISLTLFYSEP